MPQRDGKPTREEQRRRDAAAAAIAAQRAGQGVPPAPPAGSGVAPAVAAAAAAAATRTAVTAITEAPAPVASVLTAAAVTAAAAGILGAFDRFHAQRRETQRGYLLETLADRAPTLEEEHRARLVGDELDREREFTAKSRVRLDRDLSKALSITDPKLREAAVQKILDRERRYVEMREHAVAVRAIGEAEKVAVRAASPDGAYWRLNESLREHTLDCLAMAGKVWPWSVLDHFHPPLHVGCGCDLLTIAEARRAGLLRPDSYATAEQAVHAMQITEAALDDDAEGLDDELSDLDAYELLEARGDGRWDKRWARGTGKAGQFRPQRGGNPGARRIRRRGVGLPKAPAVATVKPLSDDELSVRDMPVAGLREGDRIMVNGDLQRISAVKGPGLVELDRMGLVHIDRETVRGVPAPARKGEHPDAPKVKISDEQRAARERFPAGMWVKVGGDALMIRDYPPEHPNMVQVGDSYAVHDAETQALRDEWTATFPALADWFAGDPRNAEAFDYAVTRQFKGLGKYMEEIRRSGRMQPGSVDAVLDRKRRDERAAANPVPEGKGLDVQGRIVSLRKMQEGPSHATKTVLKMTVEDDRGFRVFGTVPKALEEDLRRAHAEADIEAGRLIDWIRDNDVRLSMKADLRRSDDDPGFGFFKRPRDPKRSDDETHGDANGAGGSVPGSDGPSTRKPGIVVPTQGPTIDEVLELTTRKRPEAGGEMLPGFHFDPSLTRSEARDGDLYLPPGFFRLSRRKREGVVLRHLGGKFADALGDDGIAALAEQDGHLGNRKAIVDTYFAINSSAPERIMEAHPDAARLVAAAAHERGIALSSEAAKFVNKPLTGDTAPEKHPAHALAERLAGMDGDAVHSLLSEAGYDRVRLYSGRSVYRNHHAGAQIDVAKQWANPSAPVRAATVTMLPPLDDRDLRDGMTAADKAGRLDEYMRERGFYGKERVGAWTEFVSEDGRGVAWDVDGAEGEAPRTFTPESEQVRAARVRHIRADPLSAIKVGDDALAIRDMIDAPGGDYQFERSAGNGDTVDGTEVVLPDGATAFATYGRGERAITVQYKTEGPNGEGRWSVTAVGHADPDPQHPGRILSPAAHATAWQAIREEERRRQQQQAAAEASLHAAIERGDNEAVMKALEGKSIAESVRFLQREGLKLSTRRRATDPKTRERTITYGLIAEDGTAVKVTGGHSYSDQSVTKVEMSKPGGGLGRLPLPDGQPPKNLNELLAHGLGRADELAARFGVDHDVKTIEQGGVMKGAAAHYEPYTGAIRIRKTGEAQRISQYLRKRKAGKPLTDGDHLTFYSDLETLQHEINHGVFKGASEGRSAYNGVNKNIEESLTEETGHLLVGEWLRAYGMTDVLGAVKRNPRDARVLGVYQDYRVQMKAILDDAGVPDSERAGLLMRMKFQMTTAERHAELVRLSGAASAADAMLGRRAPKSEAERRRRMRNFFEPVVRPDLSDIDGEPEPLTLLSGRVVRYGDEVTFTYAGKPVSGVVVDYSLGWRRIAVLGEDGMLTWHNVGDVE